MIRSTSNHLRPHWTLFFSHREDEQNRLPKGEVLRVWTYNLPSVKLKLLGFLCFPPWVAGLETPVSLGVSHVLGDQKYPECPPFPKVFIYVSLISHQAYCVFFQKPIMLQIVFMVGLSFGTHRLSLGGVPLSNVRYIYIYICYIT